MHTHILFWLAATCLCDSGPIDYNRAEKGCLATSNHSILMQVHRQGAHGDAGICEHPLCPVVYKNVSPSPAQHKHPIVVIKTTLPACVLTVLFLITLNLFLL